MLHGHILLIDDEEKLRSLLKRIITLEGYTVYEAGSLKAAARLLEKETIDVVLCDVKLPDGNGVGFVKTVKLQHPSIAIILLTAYGNIPDGIRAMKNGAFDYITKGDDNDKIIPLLSRAMETVQLQKRIVRLEQQVGKKYGFESILGNSKGIQQAIALAQKVAPTDVTVLLLGETGTGKEVFSQAIHNASRRAAHAFIAINCSAFSSDLLESELFGYRAGAFTSAIKDKKGLMEEADNGTLFLDEIGEMHIDLQSKLLRVLETQEFIKIGDTRAVKVNVRIIAATNRDLQAEVAKGHFREDLFYRLNVFTIQLPALRERKEDIAVMADYFVKSFAKKVNGRMEGLAPEVIQRLQQHAWKGNIRELKNVIERAVILGEDEWLTINDLPLELQQPAVSTDNNHQHGSLSAFSLASMEMLHIQRVLNHTKGNKPEAARLLNIGLTTLYRKIEEYGLSVNE